MAEADPKEKTGEAEPKGEAKKKTDSSDLLGDDDDLMDLFDDDDSTDEELSLLAASLEDVPMTDLIAQVRDIQVILSNRRAS